MKQETADGRQETDTGTDTCTDTGSCWPRSSGKRWQAVASALSVSEGEREGDPHGFSHPVSANRQPCQPITHWNLLRQRWKNSRIASQWGNYRGILILLYMLKLYYIILHLKFSIVSLFESVRLINNKVKSRLSYALSALVPFDSSGLYTTIYCILYA